MGATSLDCFRSQSEINKRTARTKTNQIGSDPDVSEVFDIYKPEFDSFIKDDFEDQSPETSIGQPSRSMTKISQNNKTYNTGGRCLSY